MQTVSEAIRNGDLAQVITLEEQGSVLTVAAANAAAECGHIHILDYFVSKKLMADDHGYYLAALKGRIPVLDWFWDHGMRPDEDSEVLCAADHIPVLEWLEAHDIKLDEWTANCVTENIEVLDWLETTHNIIPNVHGANLAAGRGDMKFLLWMGDRGIYPNAEGIAEASDGPLDMIKWIVSHGVVPNTHAAGVAARHGNIEALEYYESMGILPLNDGSPTADNAIDEILHPFEPKERNIKILDWLLSRGFKPSSVGLSEIIRSGDAELLQWLKDNNLHKQ